MGEVFVGKIVNTHGIKGELRIKSDFERKELVFNKGIKILIKGCEYTINSYRIHKGYDMVTLEGYNNINDVLFLKDANVYIKREDLNLDNSEYLLSDLIGYTIYNNDELLGEIIDINQGINPLLIVKYDDRKYYIPIKGDYIIEVDMKEKRILVDDTVKGLIL